MQKPLQLRLRRAALSLLSVLLLAFSAPSWGERQLPKDAHYGEMTRFAYPLATIGKRTFRMAPGARMFNHQNLTVTPSAMPPQAKVLFRVDGTGQVSAIWLLTAQEAAKYKKPTTAWTPTTASAPKPAASGAAKDETTADPTRMGGRN